MMLYQTIFASCLKAPTAEAILARFSNELISAEYSHGHFVVSRDGATLFNTPFIINIWEIEFLKESEDTSRFDALLQYHQHKNGKSASALNPMDIVQQYIFGCSAFTGKDGTSPENFYEAAERITYVAVQYTLARFMD